MKAPIPALPVAGGAITIGAVVLGLVLAALGLVLTVFPRPLVAAARGWRIGMPASATPGALRAARVGALVAMAVGVIVAFA